MNRWHKLALAIILVLPGVCFGQTPAQFTLQVQNSGTPVYTRSSFAALDLTGGCSGTVSGGALQITCTGGATNPGGDANQIEYNIAGTSFGGFTMSGDCSIVVSTGVITCTGTGGAAFGPLATQATGSLSTGLAKVTTLTGLLSTAVLGDVTGLFTGTGLLRNSGAASEISGDCTTSGSNAITCTKTNGALFVASATSLTAGTGLNGAAAPTSATVGGFNSSGQAVAANPHQVIAPIKCADTSSSATTYICTTSPSISTPLTGDVYSFNAINQNNSGAATLAIGGGTAYPIKKWQGTALAAGDLTAAASVLLTFDGTNFELQTIGNPPSGGSGAITPSSIAIPSASGMIAAIGQSLTGYDAMGVTAQGSNNAADFNGAVTIVTSGTSPGQLVIGSATGNGKGAGTINVSGAYYVNGASVEVDAINTQTASYSVVAQDSYVLCNKATAMTITLISTGIPSGKTYHIKNIGAGTCTVSETGVSIDGGATGAGINLGLYQAATLVWDGTQYWQF